MIEAIILQRHACELSHGLPYRDRSDRLDKRSDLTGLRLMKSAYLSDTNAVSRELLVALCGQDREYGGGKAFCPVLRAHLTVSTTTPAELFASTLQYGLAAGFLTSNGILGAPVGRSGLPWGCLGASFPERL